MSSSILFASSNRHKFSEARDILATYGVDLGFFDCDIDEIQSESVERIARLKSIQAFGLCNAPVLVEDAALHIDALGGFPGPYSSYVFGTIGNSGILRLLEGCRRDARFLSVISYCDHTMKPETFAAEVRGTISYDVCGSGWGYDPIFVPDGHTLTYAQMTDKNRVSHRRAALLRFATWLGSRADGR